MFLELQIMEKPSCCHYTSNNLTTTDPPPHFFVLSLIHLLIIKHRVHKSSRYPVLQGWNPLSRTPRERSCISHLQALQVGLTGTVTFYEDNDNISSIHEKWLFQQAKRFPLVCKMVATVTHYSVSPQTFRAGNCYYLFIKDKTKRWRGCVCGCFLKMSFSVIYKVGTGVLLNLDKWNQVVAWVTHKRHPSLTFTL